MLAVLVNIKHKAGKENCYIFFIKLALFSCSTELLATIFSQQASKTITFMKKYDVKKDSKQELVDK